MEWGVPHADYFEGILSHKTGYQRMNDTQWIDADIIVPLFEMVYGDAIAMYTHQSDRPKPDNPGPHSGPDALCGDAGLQLRQSPLLDGPDAGLPAARRCGRTSSLRSRREPG